MNLTKTLQKGMRAKMIAKPEKRNALLYVRIKQSNRKFLQAAAEENGITVTEYVDMLFDSARGV